MKERGRLGIGVLGLGHWGPNHVRVFSQMERQAGCRGIRQKIAPPRRR